MSAFVIFDIEVTDTDGYAHYKELAQESVAFHGGKYIVRGGKHEVQEGDWRVNRLVVLEFPSYEQAQTWINSPDYAPARALRQKYANSRVVIVDGNL